LYPKSLPLKRWTTGREVLGLILASTTIGAQLERLIVSPCEIIRYVDHLIIDHYCSKPINQSPVRISLRIEGTHVVDLFEVDVGEDQLVVGGVDDGGAVGAGEHVGGGHGAEGSEHRGLCAERHFLLIAHSAWKEGKKIQWDSTLTTAFKRQHTHHSSAFTRQTHITHQLSKGNTHHSTAFTKHT
jgi:hypothetical protein